MNKETEAVNRAKSEILDVLFSAGTPLSFMDIESKVSSQAKSKPHALRIAITIMINDGQVFQTAGGLLALEADS